MDVGSVSRKYSHTASSLFRSSRAPRALVISLFKIPHVFYLPNCRLIKPPNSIHAYPSPVNLEGGHGGDALWAADIAVFVDIDLKELHALRTR